MSLEMWATVISIFATCVSVTAMQCKKMVYVRALQFLSNSLLVLEYAITKNVSASIVCAVAILQLITAITLNKKIGYVPTYVAFFFMALYAVVCIVFFEKAPDVLSGVAPCFFALGVVQKRSELYRLCATLNCTTWLIFDLWSETYSAVIIHVTLLLIDIVTIIRLDRRVWAGAISKFFEKRKVSKK